MGHNLIQDDIIFVNGVSPTSLFYIKEYCFTCQLKGLEMSIDIKGLKMEVLCPGLGFLSVTTLLCGGASPADTRR